MEGVVPDPPQPVAVLPVDVEGLGGAPCVLDGDHAVITPCAEVVLLVRVKSMVLMWPCLVVFMIIQLCSPVLQSQPITWLPQAVEYWLQLR